KNLMQQTSSGVMSRTGQPDVKWYIFDYWDAREPYVGRAQRATYLANMQKELPVIWVSQKVVRNLEELAAYEEQAINLGYEGVMIRSFEGPYKQNRSTVREGYLLKVKRF